MFFLDDINMKMVLEIFFLTFSNVNIQFAIKKLIQRSYITTEALPTTKRVKIIDKKKFAKIVLNENVEVFVVHLTFFSFNKLTIIIHLARKAQIALLFTKKIKISNNYLDFSNVFLKKNALVLQELIKFNQHAIEL